MDTSTPPPPDQEMHEKYKEILTKLEYGGILPALFHFYRVDSFLLDRLRQPPLKMSHGKAKNVLSLMEDMGLAHKIGNETKDIYYITEKGKFLVDRLSLSFDLLRIMEDDVGIPIYSGLAVQTNNENIHPQYQVLEYPFSCNLLAYLYKQKHYNQKVTLLQLADVFQTIEVHDIVLRLLSFKLVTLDPITKVVVVTTKGYKIGEYLNKILNLLLSGEANYHR